MIGMDQGLQAMKPMMIKTQENGNTLTIETSRNKHEKIL